MNKKDIAGLEATVKTNGTMTIKIEKYQSNQTDAILAAISLIDKLTDKAPITP
jgi:hypothetical protein